MRGCHEIDQTFCQKKKRLASFKCCFIIIASRNGGSGLRAVYLSILHFHCLLSTSPDVGERETKQTIYQPLIVYIGWLVRFVMLADWGKTHLDDVCDDDCFTSFLLLNNLLNKAMIAIVHEANHISLILTTIITVWLFFFPSTILSCLTVISFTDEELAEILWSPFRSFLHYLLLLTSLHWSDKYSHS